MKLLLVVATKAEIEPFLEHYSMSDDDSLHHCGKHQVKVLITGAGMVSTAYSLGKKLALEKFDLIINCGIAGSFDFDLQLGDLCRVTDDIFAELGAEDGEDFISIDSLGFGKSTQAESLPENFDPGDEFIPVTAITVNKVHGNELTIAKAISRFKPQIETMEGAAFFYSCEQSGTHGIQLRAISNYVERRDREKWNIGLAIKNLNNSLIQLMER